MGVDLIARGMAEEIGSRTEDIVQQIEDLEVGGVTFENNLSNILMDGTASVGVLDTASRGDHKHPSDTTRAPIASPSFTGVVTGITATMVGLGNVNNTSDINKSVSTAQQTALNLKQDTLISGTSIKTINGATILGSGNITITGSGISGTEILVPLPTGVKATDTANINSAIASLSDGDTLQFQKGTYLVTHQLTAISVPNVLVRGENGTKISTSETALYNIIFRVMADNCTIEDITFDQMNDVAQLPNSGAFQGCHIVYAQTFQNFTVKNCKFKGYGVTQILTQPTDTYGLGTVVIENCEFIFQTKSATYYDVSIVNADAMTVICRNNKVVCVDGGISTTWYAETAYELHAPKIISTNNQASYCYKHTLPVSYPMLHTTYNTTSTHYWDISHNQGHHLVVGINAWGTHIVTGTIIKNFNISNNIFNLHATTVFKPTIGIGFSNGNIDASFIKNGIISNNIIEMTWDTGVNMGDIVSGTPTSSTYGGVGGISLNNSNSCEDIEIFGNIIKNFAGTAVNLMCRQDHGTNKHKRIKIHHNQFINCNYSTYYDLIDNGLFVLDYCENIEIFDNLISTTSDITTSCKGLASFKSNLLNILYYNNNRDSYANSGFRYGVTGASIANVTTDDDHIIWKGASIFNNYPKYLGTTTPNGNYNVKQTHLLDAGVKRCTVPGSVKTIATVTGTWSNARQIYVSPTTEIKVGDVINFPTSQFIKVVYTSNNYIYTDTDVTTWSGGQTLTIKTPTFV